MEGGKDRRTKWTDVNQYTPTWWTASSWSMLLVELAVFIFMLYVMTKKSKIYSRAWRNNACLVRETHLYKNNDRVCVDVLLKIASGHVKY